MQLSVHLQHALFSKVTFFARSVVSNSVMSRPFLCGLSLLLLAVGEVMAGKLSLTDTITWGGDNSRSGYQS